MSDLSIHPRMPLSPEDIALLGKNKRPMKGAMIAMIVLAAPWLAVIPISFFGGNFDLGIAGFIPLTTLGGMAAIFTVLNGQLKRDLEEGMKVYFSGTVERKRFLHGKGGIYYYLEVCGKEYRVERGFYELVNESESVRLEIAPYSRHVLSVSKA